MAKNRLIKIILDTNWYISAAINRRSRRILYELLADANLQIFYSSELLREFKEVISRPKFQKIISLKQATRFMNLVLLLISANAKCPYLRF